MFNDVWLAAGGMFSLHNNPIAVEMNSNNFSTSLSSLSIFPPSPSSHVKILSFCSSLNLWKNFYFFLISRLLRYKYFFLFFLARLYYSPLITRSPSWEIRIGFSDFCWNATRSLSTQVISIATFLYFLNRPEDGHFTLSYFLTFTPLLQKIDLASNR